MRTSGETMGTKERLLEFFERNRGSFFSGEELAGQLRVSRTAVWKGVNSLRKDGYQIDAVQNKGYCFSTHTDILSVQGILGYLSPEYRDLRLEVLQTVDSTNGWVRTKAEAGEPEGYAVIAASQEKGKGRVGRSFFSPADTGVYMSLLLRPVGLSPGEASKITTMAAVAVCQAVEALSGRQAQIKWVNDIYIGGKKVSGILTEASVGLEDGLLDYGVLGIGMNAYVPAGGFPEELSGKAGAIFEGPQDDGKNRLAAEVLNRFMKAYRTKDTSAYVEEYRKRCLVLGREILVLGKGEARKAMALDVDEDCRLVVRYGDGRMERLSSGEIRIQM